MNPATGEVICEVYEGDKADVDIAVESAKKGLKAWQSFSVVKRSDILYKISETILKN